MNLAADTAGEYYYHQGEKVYLDLDPTRLVVVSPAPYPVADALRAIGITSGESERLLQAPDHWLFRLSAATTAEQAVAGSTLLKGDRRYRFVSNVYKTRHGGDDVIPLNRVVVKFRQGVPDVRADSLIAVFGMRLVRPPRPDSGFTYHVLEYPRDSVSSLRVAALLDRHPLVAWADPDKISNRKPHYVPTDPYYSWQWHLKNTVIRNGVTVDDNVESAWDLTIGEWSPTSGGLRVGVIGDGVDAAHPDFDGRVMGGYDAAPCDQPCPDNETKPYRGDNHETLVAGLIVAHHNNGGVAGIAPGVYMVTARIFRGEQVASDQGIADAINFTWQWNTAHVINNSWGGGAPSNAITNAIVAANSQGRGGRGTVVVFAAGNSSQRSAGYVGPVEYPATLPEVIAVGAINRNGYLTDYSPEGSELDIVAPSGHFTGRCIGDVTTTDLTDGTGCNDGPNGDNIYSTSFSGTSAAAPQVAAVAALVISRDPDLTSTAVKKQGLPGRRLLGPSFAVWRGKVGRPRECDKCCGDNHGPNHDKNGGLV
ncbi:MAG: S8 family serine peptidase [Gemmatimonadaceae bacterium]